MKKIISILLIVLMISMISNIVYADEPESSITDATSVITAMTGANDMSSPNNRIGAAINLVLGLLQIAGTGISITVVSLLGIKYILASPSEKADTKKSILPVVIGCIMVFGAVNIISAVYDFANKIQTDEGGV